MMMLFRRHLVVVVIALICIVAAVSAAEQQQQQHHKAKHQQKQHHEKALAAGAKTKQHHEKAKTNKLYHKQEKVKLDKHLNYRSMQCSMTCGGVITTVTPPPQNITTVTITPTTASPTTATTPTTTTHDPTQTTTTQTPTPTVTVTTPSPTTQTTAGPTTGSTATPTPSVTTVTTPTPTVTISPTTPTTPTPTTSQPPTPTTANYTTSYPIDIGCVGTNLVFHQRLAFFMMLLNNFDADTTYNLNVLLFYSSGTASIDADTSILFGTSNGDLTQAIIDVDSYINENYATVYITAALEGVLNGSVQSQDAFDELSTARVSTSNQVKIASNGLGAIVIGAMVNILQSISKETDGQIQDRFNSVMDSSATFVSLIKVLGDSALQTSGTVGSTDLWNAVEQGTIVFSFHGKLEVSGSLNATTTSNALLRTRKHHSNAKNHHNKGVKHHKNTKEEHKRALHHAKTKWHNKSHEKALHGKSAVHQQKEKNEKSAHHGKTTKQHHNNAEKEKKHYSKQQAKHHSF